MQDNANCTKTDMEKQMTEKLILPEIGEGVMEGEVVEWLVEEGSAIEKDTPVVSVLTDKATVDIPCPFSGTLKQILVKPGDIATVGEPLAEIQTQDIGSATEPPQKESAETSSDYYFKLPEIGEGVMEGEIVEWQVEKGSRVEKDQIVVSILTDKATVDIPSPCSGTVVKILGDTGSIVNVGQDILVMATSDIQSSVPQKSEPVNAPVSGPVAVKETAAPNLPVDPARNPSLNSFGIPLAGPAVRRAAHQRDIDLRTIHGTGPGNRITLQDLERKPTTAVPSAPAAQFSSKTPERKPITGLRKAIFNNMALSKRVVPHFTYVAEVDMEKLVQLRSELKAPALEQGVSLSYLPFIMKAVILALKKYPIINASVDEEKEEIVFHKDIHLGIATSTENGLMVPVIKHADQQSMLSLASKMAELSEKARARKTKLDEVSGSTFTITSLGKLGGLLATPIINYPEAAILGIHEIKEKAVVRDHKIVIRHMMNLAGSFDHRIIDGDVGATFIQEIRNYLEHPTRLMIF
ncbi:MAG: hypothetical protein CSA81_12330 [Acidobacteria bacterium]|nr:MAG: hypothetical protein CSA81_12330 [Acidobacteriota bacterium]